MTGLDALDGPGVVYDALQHLELEFDRRGLVVCRDDIRLGDGEMPRCVGDGLGGEIITLPLEFREPVLLGRGFHVAEEKGDGRLVRDAAAVLRNVNKEG